VIRSPTLSPGHVADTYCLAGAGGLAPPLLVPDDPAPRELLAPPPLPTVFVLPALPLAD